MGHSDSYDSPELKHDRFDFPKNVRDVFDKALKLGLVDATTFLCYGLNGVSTNEILIDLVECAWNNRHSDGNKSNGELGCMIDELKASGEGS